MLPLFPLEVVLFPGMPLPLHIFEPRYRLMIGECLRDDQPFGVILATGGNLAPVGCAARVRQVVTRYPDGRLDILSEGERRFRIGRRDTSLAYLRAEVEWRDDVVEPFQEELAHALDLHRRTLQASLLPEATDRIAKRSQPSFTLGASRLFDLPERQRLLELDSERARLVAVANVLAGAEGLLRTVGGNGRPH